MSTSETARGPESQASAATYSDDALFFDNLWASIPDAEKSGRNRSLSRHLQGVRDWSGFFSKGSSIGGGGYGEAYAGGWKGRRSTSGPPPPTVIKMIRPEFIQRKGAKEATKHVNREVKVWLQLRHPNIVPFLGVTYDFSGFSDVPSLISVWMPKGTLKDFLRRNGGKENQEWIFDIARGLDHLHKFIPTIIHGDIKPANILVNANGSLCLGDFGVSWMLCDDSLWITTASEARGTVPMMAPELLSGEQITVTKASDIYAFGMTVYDMIAEEAPFSTCLNAEVVKAAVTVRDQRPSRPRNTADWMWAMIQQCWHKLPSIRPSIEDVLDILERNSKDPHQDKTKSAGPRVIRVSDGVRGHEQEISDSVAFAAPDLRGQIHGELIMIGSGGFGDTYRGDWDNAGQLTPVAIKLIRLSLDQSAPAFKSFNREVSVWSRLQHPNVVKLFGITDDLYRGLPGIVSEYMPNGDLRNYMRNSHVDVRPPLMLDVARGIEYLHNLQPRVVHGDFKSSNVLVNQDGIACIVDFGLSRIMSDTTLWRTNATQAPGTLRWMAPELLDGTENTVSMQGDVYGFAMTILEAVTDAVPFSQLRNDGAVIAAVLVRKEHPPRPPLIPDWMWAMMNRCWAYDPSQRPPIGVTVQELERIVDKMNELRRLLA